MFNLLAAEGWQAQDNFNGVHIVGDEHQLRSFLLNQSENPLCTTVDTGSRNRSRCLGVLELRLSLFLQPRPPFERGFWLVLQRELEQLLLQVAVNSVIELINCRRNSEALQQNALLTLPLDVGGPTHKSGKVPLWLEILSEF